MRFPIALLALLLLFPSDGRAYVKDPEGRLIGLLVDPDDKPMPTPCRLAPEVSGIVSRAKRMKEKLQKVVDGERALGDAMDGVAALYEPKFPEKAEYLHSLAHGIKGAEKQHICTYIEDLIRALEHTIACAPDPKYVSKQCHFIPQDCVNDRNIEARFRGAEKAMAFVLSELKENEKELLDGLPKDHVYRMKADGEMLPFWESKCLYKKSQCPEDNPDCPLNCDELKCKFKPPLCRQHMDYSLETFEIAQGPRLVGKVNGLQKALREAAATR